MQWILAPPLPETIILAEIAKTLEHGDWVDWICPVDDIVFGDEISVMVFD